VKIVSELNHLVLSVKGASKERGAGVVMQRYRTGDDSQLWRVDLFLQIRSKLDNVCLTLDGNVAYTRKVTIRPEFFDTIPNFKGLSRKKYEVIQDAKLSRIPNPDPNLSGFNVKMCQALSS